MYRSTVDPCCVVELSVPMEGYNHASHRISAGEVTVGWCVQCGTWLEGRAT